MKGSFSEYIKGALLTLFAAAFVFGSAGCGAFTDKQKQDAPEGSVRGVVINEVVSSNHSSMNDEVFGSADWVELKNVSSSDENISGWRLGDNVSFSKALTFPEGTVIPAGGFITVFCAADAVSAEGRFAAPFGISRTGENIVLGSPDGKTEVLEVPELGRDVSYARRGDGSYGWSGTPTFGAENKNIVSSPEEVVIVPVNRDELRFSELVTGGAGWVELVNISGGTVELSEYCLSDREDDPEKWRFPEMTLAPGAFITVELNQLDPEALSASFKVSRGESAIWLFDSAGIAEDCMTVDPAMPVGISAVRSGDGVAYTSHITKGEANSEETFPAVEWTEIDVKDPSCRLYISEVLPKNKYGVTDAYGDRSDWAELYNPSDMPAYLNDYYLSDDPNDPLKWQLPQAALLPGEYCLIFLSGGESTDGEIHAPFRLSETDPGIYLSCLDGMKQDKLLIPEGLIPNVSIGRTGEGEIRYYAAPTPGSANTTYGFDDASMVLAFDPDSVYISEVSAVSAPKSGESDWIELVNCSSRALNLSGWSLTDDPDEPRKYVFGGLTVAAGGFTVVSCGSGSSSAAPFSISNGGETLYLVNGEGAFVDVFETGMTVLGATSGRADRTQTGSRCFFASPTKGYKNGTPLDGIVHEPVFSYNGLYSDGELGLAISCSTAGAKIRYTLDGTVPTESSALYSEPLNITRNTVVRAKAFREGLIPSPMAAHTYLVNESFTMPVVSISLPRADYDRMYTSSMSPNGGITHGPMVGCFVEYYIDGQLALSSGAGVRVSGASTSLHAQKSLGLYFRAGYGRSSLDFPLFEGCDITSFRSVVLRNAGQDADYARLRDSYMSVICQGMEIDVSYFKPVIVFVNGEYRGIYDLKENMNEDYIASHYGVDRKYANIIKRNGMRLAGDNTDYHNLRSFCRNGDFSVQSNYEKLKERMDVVSFMDYLIARTYFYDGDMFNQKYWRTTDGTLKWRAVFYDSDYAMFGNTPSSSILGSYFNPGGVSSAHGSITNMDFYCALNENREWRDEFITRYIYYVKYVFCPENALPLYDALVEVYRPEMARHISRWHMPSSVSSWENNVAALRSCIERRPEYALRILKNYYGLSDERFAEYERAADEMKDRLAVGHN